MNRGRPPQRQAGAVGTPAPSRARALRFVASLLGVLLSCVATAQIPAASIGAHAATDAAVVERVTGQVPSLDEGEAARLAQAAVGRAIPDLVLRDRNGKPVRLSDYRGKPLLVSFIYTACFQVCPTQTRNLYAAVKGLDRLLGEDQFNVVSIGFNQPFDSPEALRDFARQHRIQYRNWEFLSPSAEQVEELTRAFGFSYVATPAGFEHVLGVSVVDPAGRIFSQVLGDRMSAELLGTPLRQLLLWQPVEAPTTVARLFERVRILCTVYDADTGEYRYDYKLILEIVSGILFFLSAFVYLFLEWRRQRRERRQRRDACPPAPAEAVSGGRA